MADGQMEQPAIILSSDRWFEGVVGPIAFFVMARLNRPVVVVSFHGDLGFGTACAPDCFRLADTLNACKGLLAES